MALGFKWKQPTQTEKSHPVDVWTEKVNQHQYRVSAKITLAHPKAQIWHILTDYESLPEFVPHLVTSKRLTDPSQGIRIEQVGTKCPLHFCFSARVVLDIVENQPDEIKFSMVEGDFRSFSGEWRLVSVGNSEQALTDLYYSLSVMPKMTMPVGLIEKQLYQDLPVNLLAVSQRISQVFSVS